MTSPILLRKIETYSVPDIEAFFSDALTYLYSGHPPFQKGEKLLLKPNLLAPKPPQSAVTTHPTVLEALIRVLKKFQCDIYMGDHTPIYSQQHTTRKTQLHQLFRR